MADRIGPTPRNPLLGKLADYVGGADDFLRGGEGGNNQPYSMISNFLGLPAIQRTANRASYGESLTSGSGMTTAPLPDTADAALSMPIGKLAGLAGMAAGAAKGSRKLLTDPKVQEAIDGWIEAGLMDRDVIAKHITEAMPTPGPRTVYRAEFGEKKLAELAALKRGDIVPLDMKSTAGSMDALHAGVLEPNDYAPHHIFEIQIPAGASVGRDIRHSDPLHPENVQQEFMTRPNAQFVVSSSQPGRTVLRPSTNYFKKD